MKQSSNPIYRVIDVCMSGLLTLCLVSHGQTFGPTGLAAAGTRSSQWEQSRTVSQAVAHSVLVGGNAGVPAGSAASLRSNGTLLDSRASQGLLSQPLTAQSAQTGPAQGTSTTLLSQQAGSSRARVSGTPIRSAIEEAPLPGPCMSQGIASVNGQRSGLTFTPVAGSEGTYRVQGCGFGTSPGEVYLTGLRYGTASTSASGRRGLIASRLAPDQLSFRVTANGWGDRQITAVIDPNTSGYYDSTNVTLNVKTAGGQVYKAAGFTFGAAYDIQVLSSIPTSSAEVSLQLATVSDASGSAVTPVFETPWVSTSPQKTLGVNRNRISWTLPAHATFPGGTDTYVFHFAPGFRLANNGVQMYHSNLAIADCQSVNGQFSSNGSWNINYLSPTSFQIAWQEQACWPTGNSGNAIDYGSVSVYELVISVWGPRGTSPW